MVSRNELEVVSDTKSDIIPFDQTPEWLPQAASNKGLEGLDKDDVKTPRVLMLHAQSPQIKSFPGVAIPGEFWHTGMNVPLGSNFLFVSALVSKRVILWRPREDNGGGILAFSREGKTWATGGNMEFRVKLKGKKDPVVWKTGKDVLSSRLTEFGTMDVEDPESAPAAMTSYEYLAYLIKNPELSPVVIGVSKTALPNGKSLNTSLMTLAKSGKPMQSIAIRCFADPRKNDMGEWDVFNFKTEGLVQKDIYQTVVKMADQYGDYKIEYTQDDAPVAATKETDDEIPY